MADTNKKGYKTQEQIAIAQKTIKLLQDYIELSKTESKLNDPDNKKALQNQIDVTNETLFVNIKEL